MKNYISVLLLYCIFFNLRAQIESPSNQFTIQNGYQEFNHLGQRYMIEVDSAGNLRIVPNSNTSNRYIIFGDDQLDLEFYDKSDVFTKMEVENNVEFDLNEVPVLDLRFDRIEWKSPSNQHIEAVHPSWNLNYGKTGIK